MCSGNEMAEVLMDFPPTNHDAAGRARGEHHEAHYAGAVPTLNSEPHVFWHLFSGKGG